MADSEPQRPGPHVGKWWAPERTDANDVPRTLDVVRHHYETQAPRLGGRASMRKQAQTVRASGTVSSTGCGSSRPKDVSGSSTPRQPRSPLDVWPCDPVRTCSDGAAGIAARRVYTVFEHHFEVKRRVVLHGASRRSFWSPEPLLHYGCTFPQITLTF